MDVDEGEGAHKEEVLFVVHVQHQRGEEQAALASPFHATASHATHDLLALLQADQASAGWCRRLRKILCWEFVQK